MSIDWQNDVHTSIHENDGLDGTASWEMFYANNPEWTHEQHNRELYIAQYDAMKRNLTK